MMLDKLSEMFNTQPDQNELFSFMMEQAQNYGMDPNQFIRRPLPRLTRLAPSLVSSPAARP